jgi:transcriptional regulatory protein RtcR
MTVARVAIGLLGSTLDVGRDPDRWEKWRPTVALAQHPDLLLARLELLHHRKFTALAERVAADVRQCAPETMVNLHLLDFDDPWDFEQVYAGLHDWARGYPFRPDEEQYLVHITTGSHVAQICLFLLTESRLLPGQLVQTVPPRRQEPMPGTYAVIDLDLSRYDRLAERFKRQRHDGVSLLKSGIDTRSPRFNALIDEIEQVAIHSAAPLLLSGPTGSGKSNLARRIYELKRDRRQVAGPFVEVNCATLRGDGATSALFGHRRGAFTGATGDRAGLLRSADGGVLFLDEIGELGPDEQAMLLRAVEEKRFLPVGSDKEVASDFQLIAGTNRDLSADVRAGRFRDDLLARINLWAFALPSLRDRPEDIEPNLAYELDRFAERQGTAVTFNREARERFLRFATGGAAAWSGNFRDLSGAVTRMATLAGGGRITVEVVDAEIARLAKRWGGDAEPADELDALLGPAGVANLDRFDRVQLAEVVRVCRSSRSLSDAGRTLFAASRQRKANPNDADRLRKYLARFGLDGKRVLRGGAEE